MTGDVSPVVDALAARTGAPRARLRGDVDRLVSKGIDPEDAAATVEYRHADRDADCDLFDVAAVGWFRAHHLLADGYESVADLARVSVGELCETRGLSDTVAPVVAESARALDEGRDLVAETAEEVGADREELAGALSLLRTAGETVAESRDSLRALYAPANRPSLVDVEGIDPRRAYYLYEAGFRTPAGVAAADPEELAEVRYFGATTATRAVESAAAFVQSRAPGGDSRGRGDSGEDSRGRGDSGGGGDAPDEDTTTDDTTTDDTTTDDTTTDDAGGGADGDAGGGASLPFDPAVEPGVYPETMTSRDQWLLWRSEGGRKMPYAPWRHEGRVDAMDPENWVGFETAREYREALPGSVGLAFSLTLDDPLTFVDYDDVRSPEGVVERLVRRHIEEAGSYAAVSTSGSGVHLFCLGGLSEEVRTIQEDLEATGEGSIEVYDHSRFVAVTGDHLAGTPAEVRDGSEFLERLEREYATVRASTPEPVVAEPRRSREELRDLDTTADIRDLFDAIRQVRPSDVRLRSPVTEERANGTRSRDPSWAHSESGTRLGELDDCWIYREGNVRLDALQVVALEEGVVDDATDYPSGAAFWEAVEALRDRGASLPRYVPADARRDLPPEAHEPGRAPNRARVLRIVNRGSPVYDYTHPYDRTYYERTAYRVWEALEPLAGDLFLPPAVVYRAAELFVTAQDEDLVRGASVETSVAAAVVVAAAEADVPRPLGHVASTLDCRKSAVRNKMNRLVHETELVEEFSPADLVPGPTDYVPFVVHRLGRDSDGEVAREAERLLEETPPEGGTTPNPLSLVAGAVYAAGRVTGRDVNQRAVADAATVTTVTVRNHYRRYLDGE